MSLRIEGYSDSVSNTPTWTAISASADKRNVFLQARNNIFVRRASDTAIAMVVLGETSGSIVDLGIIAPLDIEVQAISGTATVSMYSLDPGERR